MYTVVGGVFFVWSREGCVCISFICTDRLTHTEGGWRHRGTGRWTNELMRSYADGGRWTRCQIWVSGFSPENLEDILDSALGGRGQPEMVEMSQKRRVHVLYAAI